MVRLFDNINEQVLRTYIFWAMVLVGKMLLMSVLTIMQRFRKKAFVNEEDIVTDKKLKLKFDDPDVERVRRAHRNDLENIFTFLAIGFCYMLTNPDPWLAGTIFRLVAAGRIVHTVVYALVIVPQPTRLLAWLVPYAACLYMTAQTLLYVM
ncbi:microsomal glutathione S-transferase 1-like [Wyeomyia smithii]|uniref:microsomal glutathione S-transferase 1-like n=1 Tax=Wyeomyia smithii TaxID=174621 RepID=UPI002467F48D|nr:microsomal glutathione S-transferase 1-like [Wyeomyia smithii]